MVKVISEHPYLTAFVICFVVFCLASALESFAKRGGSDDDLG